MSNTLTKAGIVEAVYVKIGRNRVEAKKLVDPLLRLSKQAIKKDRELLISSLGKFESYDKKVCKGRNPQTSTTLTPEHFNFQII